MLQVWIHLVRLSFFKPLNPFLSHMDVGAYPNQCAVKVLYTLDSSPVHRKTIQFQIFLIHTYLLTLLPFRSASILLNGYISGLFMYYIQIQKDEVTCRIKLWCVATCFYSWEDD